MKTIVRDVGCKGENRINLAVVQWKALQIIWLSVDFKK